MKLTSDNDVFQEIVLARIERAQQVSPEDRLLTGLLQPELRFDRQMSIETITGTVKTVVDVVDTPFQIELYRLSSQHSLEEVWKGVVSGGRLFMRRFDESTWRMECKFGSATHSRLDSPHRSTPRFR